jgi:sialic acid synthase SpsE
MNLRAIQTLAHTLDIPVGLSDHSQGILAATAAVGIGISILEKHLTLDRNLDGPDHRASEEPGEFARLVQAVRTAERMMGTGEKRMTPGEYDTRRAVRRTLVYARAMSAGERIASGDITSLRTGREGFDVGREMDVVGQTLVRDAERFQSVQASDFAI